MLRSLSRFALILTLACLFEGLAGPVQAQDLFRSLLGPPRPYYQRPAPGPAAPSRTAPAPADKSKELPKIVETPPAYEGEMSKLAEILGALHYLRPLCGTKDGSRWRNEMNGMIEAEQAPPERRDRMIASFNRSYVAYEQSYRTCTPAADLAIRRFLDEGARLSREIATRYGN